MSAAEERTLGEQASPQLTEEFGGRVTDSRLQGYVTEIGNKLKDQTEVDGPQRVWDFTLLDSDIINAFALPGEKVFISRGLADQLTNEAQLAGVLGHEIGHVMARHTAERMSQATWIGIGSQVLGAAVGAAVKDPTLGQALPAIATQGGQLFVLKFSREQESEADSLGMRYMAKAGYNPRGQLQVMEVLKAASGGASPPEFLATHPLPETRIQQIEQKLAGEYAYTQTQPDKFGLFPDRYQQRYLAAVKSDAPAKKQKTPKRSAIILPDTFDTQGRTRLLASVVLDDPTTWCSVCAAKAADELHP